MADKVKNKHSRTWDLITCPIYGVIGIGYSILLIIIIVQDKYLSTLGAGAFLALWCLYGFIVSLIRLIKNKYNEELIVSKSDSKSSET